MFRKEIQRAIGQLPGIDITSDSYVCALTALRMLLELQEQFKGETLPETVPAPHKPEYEKPVTNTIVPAEEPELIPNLDAAFVRSKLKDAAANGVVIEPYIKKFVKEGDPIKFSSIKPENYAALIADLEEAKKDA